MNPRRQLKLNNKLVPPLVGLLILLQLILPYRGWVILLIGLGGIWLVSYLWAKSLASSLHLNREMRFGWAQVGDRLEERFTLLNVGEIPALWVQITDHTTMPGYDTGRVTGVDARNRTRWYTDGICTQRGIFTLGPTTLRAGDPFGFYSVTIAHSESSTLTVMPPIVPLPEIEVASGGRAGEGRARLNLFERTVASTQVRQYLPGDSLSWIHWPTSVRHQDFYVRQFDSTPAGDWWIVLDLDAEMQAGAGFSTTEEHSVILCASLADRGLQAGKSVGLVSYGQQLVWLPPMEGDVQRQKILRELALIRPGPRSLTDLLRLLQPAARQLGSLVVITANASGNWIEALLPLIQRGAIPTILVLDPASYGRESVQNNSERLLSQLGLAHYTITADLLDRPEARPGHAGHWEWRVLPSGRAVPTGRVRDLNWKVLQ